MKQIVKKGYFSVYDTGKGWFIVLQDNSNKIVKLLITEGWESFMGECCSRLLIFRGYKEVLNKILELSFLKQKRDAKWRWTFKYFDSFFALLDFLLQFLSKHYKILYVKRK